MSRRVLAGVLVALGTALLTAGGAAAAAGPQAVSVAVDRTQISTRLGHAFSFRSTIRNAGSGPASGLIAHLNVLSLRKGTYVDPEDWSSQRTRYLETIPPGGSVTLTWPMKAVNDGSFAVYVAVIPRDGAATPPTTGSAIHLAVAERRTLNSGGILPLALGIPALLALAWAALWRLRSRRAAGT
jgi:hypothetical protein